MRGRECKLRVTVGVKRLLDCPLQGKSIYTKLKWGHRTLWGGRDDATQPVVCKDRNVVWNEAFTSECVVFVAEEQERDDPDARARILARQPSSGFLRLSVRKDSGKGMQAHKRYGFLNVYIIDWALAYGGPPPPGEEGHTVRRLLDGTKSTSYFEVQVAIQWLDPMPASIQPGALAANSLDTPKGGTGDDDALGAEAAPRKGEPLNKPVDEVELTAEQKQWMEGVTLQPAAVQQQGEDKVQAAIEASRMSPEATAALVEELVMRVLQEDASPFVRDASQVSGLLSHLGAKVL
mmetsp:Transcript_59065/g.140493  ORF Transcript_59065/g.140493 Transcript_59065/m.140493 type:complete len:292 (-) Transcript_59065:115-990(-)